MLRDRLVLIVVLWGHKCSWHSWAAWAHSQFSEKHESQLCSSLRKGTVGGMGITREMEKAGDCYQEGMRGVCAAGAKIKQR